MGTATYIKRKNGTGDAAVYRVTPPLEITDWNDKPIGTTEYVWVSASDVMFSGPETYIFPCTETGEVTDWGELPGSYRGGLNHAEALAGAGYTIAPVQS